MLATAAFLRQLRGIWCSVRWQEQQDYCSADNAPNRARSGKPLRAGSAPLTLPRRQNSRRGPNYDSIVAA